VYPISNRGETRASLVNAPCQRLAGTLGGKGVGCGVRHTRRQPPRTLEKPGWRIETPSAGLEKMVGVELSNRARGPENTKGWELWGVDLIVRRLWRTCDACQG
jgi:hypothetical protein